MELSYQQVNSVTASRLTFPFHKNQPNSADVKHKAVCAAVRAWAGEEGRLSVALKIREACESLGLAGVDVSGNGDVWNVKLFRWLDNKDDSPGYRQNVELLYPAIEAALPIEFRTRLAPQDCLLSRLAEMEKEVSEAKQAVMLNAPKHQKLKEMSEGIVSMFRVDPELAAPLMAMVTTMLGGV